MVSNTLYIQSLLNQHHVVESDSHEVGSCECGRSRGDEVFGALNTMEIVFSLIFSSIFYNS